VVLFRVAALDTHVLFIPTSMTLLVYLSNIILRLNYLRMTLKCIRILDDLVNRHIQLVLDALVQWSDTLAMSCHVGILP